MGTDQMKMFIILLHFYNTNITDYDVDKKYRQLTTDGVSLESRVKTINLASSITYAFSKPCSINCTRHRIT